GTPVADICAYSVFKRVHTLMGAPQSWDLANARAAVLGIPFDAGTHPGRIGARLGPAAIREQSALVRRYEPPLHNFDPVHNLGLLDCGNSRVTPGIIGESFAAIEEAVWRIAGAGVQGRLPSQCQQERTPLSAHGNGYDSYYRRRRGHRSYRKVECRDIQNRYVMSKPAQI